MKVEAVCRSFQPFHTQHRNDVEMRTTKAGKEMTALCRDVPEAIGNTIELSSRLQFELSDLGL